MQATVPARGAFSRRVASLGVPHTAARRRTGVPVPVAWRRRGPKAISDGRESQARPAIPSNTRSVAAICPKRAAICPKRARPPAAAGPASDPAGQYGLLGS